MARRVTDEQRDEIRRLRADGHTKAAIMRTVGVSITTVRRTLGELNPKDIQKKYAEWRAKIPDDEWRARRYTASANYAVRYRERLAGRPRPTTCEVCGKCPAEEGLKGNARGIAFDHCHRCEQFRGWLCMRCNFALGLAKDDPNLLLQLAAYLRMHVQETGCE